MSLFPSIAAARRILGPAWCWPHFSVAELACRCQGRYCDGAYWHDPSFLNGLEAMRAKVGRPLVIQSGHRCALWNAHVGGAPRSQHKRMAVDISLHAQNRKQLLDAAQAVGFTGIGCGRQFLHIDRRAHPARWYYPGSCTLWKSC